MMRFAPFLSPEDAQGGEEKRFTEEEMLHLLDEKLSAEKQRYEAALEQESSLRRQAENTLLEQQKALRAHEMRLKAQDALRRRDLPEQLLGALNFTSDESLERTLAAAEEAFRAALEEGVRSRLRGQAPSLEPLPQKNRKSRSLSYQEAAANYLSGLNNH